ncbi:MAG: murein biosynthesis integral membrane protein MurJ [Anaerolineae bacterium]|nr:murein biosynthesis integral membrane protein MurJ [Anaerolineae bacterium]MDW8069146.1 murein biosynthesis integral membrane protein MurJ [Anaerolineae bacterium]
MRSHSNGRFLSGLSPLARASLMVAAFFALDKVLAFGRAVVVARQFRFSAELDAFNAANNLPDMLFALISGGALAMAFIPLMTRALTLQGRAQAWSLFSRVMNLAFVVTVSLAVLIALFAEPIVRAEIGIAPGFGRSQQRLVAELMRLHLVATVLFSLSGLVTAGLQAHQHFLLPALAPTLYNVGQIFGALVLAPEEGYVLGPLRLPHFGLGVRGLVFGVILGAALHLAVQVPGLIHYRFRWTPILDLRSPEIRDVLRVIGPRLATMFVIQLVFVARDNLASRLGQTGAVSFLTYGWMIMQVPETVLGTAVAVALLPALSRYAAYANWQAFGATLEKVLRLLVALTLPVAVIGAVGLEPLIQAVFGLDGGGRATLAWTTRAFLLALPGYAIQEVLTRSFYARKEALIPLFSVMIRFAVYLAIGISALAFFRPVGAPAIALADLALSAEALVMLRWLNRRLAQRIRLRRSLLRGLGAALLAGGLSYGLMSMLPGPAGLAALSGMGIAGLLALRLIWREIRSLQTL